MIEVTGCRLLIKPYKIEQQDEVYKKARLAGIEIPEESQRKTEINVDRGTVIAIGEHANEDYVGHVKVGDVIGYARYAGKFIEDTDKTMYLVINDEDIVCIIKE